MGRRDASASKNRKFLKSFVCNKFEVDNCADNRGREVEGKRCTCVNVIQDKFHPLSSSIFYGVNVRFNTSPMSTEFNRLSSLNYIFVSMSPSRQLLLFFIFKIAKERFDKLFGVNQCQWFKILYCDFSCQYHFLTIWLCSSCAPTKFGPNYHSDTQSLHPKSKFMNSHFS